MRQSKLIQICSNPIFTERLAKEQREMFLSRNVLVSQTSK